MWPTRRAKAAAKSTGSLPPPKHILNAPTKLMKDQGYGAGYAYDHDAEDGFSGQDYFPERMKRGRHIYRQERGFERDLKTPARLFREAARAAAGRLTPAPLREKESPMSGPRSKSPGWRHRRRAALSHRHRRVRLMGHGLSLGHADGQRSGLLR
jgi:hypothetical protein